LITRNMAALPADNSDDMKAVKKKGPKRLPRRGAARVIGESPIGADTVANDPGVVERPDGWYWAAPDGHQEFGPFDSRASARADRDRYSEEAPSEGETVQEAEREIGIADWIDAETGEPAEGQSPPHLEES
jgi:hypothetical protein